MRTSSCTSSWHPLCHFRRRLALICILAITFSLLTPSSGYRHRETPPSRLVRARPTTIQRNRTAAIEEAAFEPIGESFSEWRKTLYNDPEREVEPPRKTRVSRVKAAIRRAALYVPRKLGGWVRGGVRRVKNLVSRLHSRFRRRRPTAPPPPPKRRGPRGSEEAKPTEGLELREVKRPLMPPASLVGDRELGPEHGFRGLPLALGDFLRNLPEKYWGPRPEAGGPPPPETDNIIIRPRSVKGVLLTGEMQQAENAAPQFVLLWKALKDVGKPEEATRLSHLMSDNSITPETELEELNELSGAQKKEIELAILLNRHLAASDPTNKSLWFFELGKVQQLLTDQQKITLDEVMGEFSLWIDGFERLRHVGDVKAMLPRLRVNPEDFIEKMRGFFPRIQAAFNKALSHIQAEHEELSAAHGRLLDLKNRMMLDVDVFESEMFDMEAVRSLDLLIGGVSCNLNSLLFLKSVVIHMSSLLLNHENKWFKWMKTQWMNRIAAIVFAFLRGSEEQKPGLQSCVNFLTSLAFEKKPANPPWYLYVFQRQSRVYPPIVWD
ncbi:hypothetical protein Emag_006717 [Eimeria magna]